MARLPEAFLAEIRAATPMKELVSARVALRRSGDGWVGLCPFHNEKSPSFRVYAAHANCFGCGWHGDAVSFVQQSEGISFRDAVEKLAGAAGLEMPQGTPEEQAEAKRLGALYAVLEQAATGFQAALWAGPGRGALDYLRERGLSDETIRSWRLGWADGSAPVPADLDAAIGAGLVIRDDRGAPVRRFRNRIMFPIHDRRGRVISFGGRVLPGGSAAKYINGPETPVFVKGQHLYGAHRVAPGAPGGLWVAEGYLDVIAAHQAGLTGAVAPLGTSVTEGQLDTLFGLGPAPVFAFDGDAAGDAARSRAVELALPLVRPDKMPRFARLPAGTDPAEALGRPGGPDAMLSMLAAAVPLEDALYEHVAARTAAAVPGRTAGAMAALREALAAAVAPIKHSGLAGEVRVALLNRFFAERRAAHGGPSLSLVARATPEADTVFARYRDSIAADIEAATRDVAEAVDPAAAAVASRRLDALLDLRDRLEAGDEPLPDMDDADA